jgi:LmbE family N-acetylglucosaminyl deacetylase
MAGTAGIASEMVMGIDDLKTLLDRTMVLVAHPDDECILCGGLLQRMRKPVVVYATDGAPQDPYFWKAHGSRSAYSRLRQKEARRALERVGVNEIVFLAECDERLVDQELFRNLTIAYELLHEAIVRLGPSAVLTLAYEGGHPDHDSCSFLASKLGAATGLPVWEAPLYRGVRAELSVQEFAHPNGTEVFYAPSLEEIARKRAMCQEYSSQGDFLKVFDIEQETYRPQVPYDYTQPPHEGQLNYERWQWSMTGREVSSAFEGFGMPGTVTR